MVSEDKTKNSSNGPSLHFKCNPEEAGKKKKLAILNGCLSLLAWASAAGFMKTTFGLALLTPEFDYVNLMVMVSD